MVAEEHDGVLHGDVLHLRVLLGVPFVPVFFLARSAQFIIRRALSLTWYGMYPSLYDSSSYMTSVTFS